jgi:hypothetical protein
VILEYMYLAIKILWARTGNIWHRATRVFDADFREEDGLAAKHILQDLERARGFIVTCSAWVRGYRFTLGLIGILDLPVRLQKLTLAPSLVNVTILSIERRKVTQRGKARVRGKDIKICEEHIALIGSC